MVRPDIKARVFLALTAWCRFGGHASFALIFSIMMALVASSVPLQGEAWAQSSVRPPANATTSEVPARAGAPQAIPGRPAPQAEQPVAGNVPGRSLGNASDSELWRKLREGHVGTVSIPDSKAGQLIRGPNARLSGEEAIRQAAAGNQGATSFLGGSSIQSWVEFRRGPLSTYGAYAMGGTLALLVLFFLVRGRIKIEHGASGRLVERFGSIERLGHWLLAFSFIILAITGLNLLYGRAYLIPVFGPETYAAIAYAGKLTHNYVAFAFMAGLVLIVANWVVYNIPHPRDLMWLAKGGGLFVKGVHPSSKKFNAGQKIIFWLVVLGGISISLSGLALMFPMQSAMFAKTFAFLNAFGLNLPTDLSPIQEMQYQALWHTIMALFLICVILAHIYIGSIGMEGAIDAMTTGQVDENWAREHHDLWLEEELAKQKSIPRGAQPAE